MNTTGIQFNINNFVRVKLTNHGRAFHAMKHAMFNMQNGLDLKYEPPKEDADGWSSWQLHDLMHSFGEQCFTGNGEPPFDITIEIVVEGA